MRGSKEEQGSNVQLTRDISLSQLSGSDGAAQHGASPAMHRPQSLEWFANDLIRSLMWH